MILYFIGFMNADVSEGLGAMILRQQVLARALEGLGTMILRQEVLA